jgi:hypothetical protein
MLQPRRNPYRGPREFRRGDQLPNREREARELTDRVVAERIVLLHAPSGAGKTSLIEAAVVNELIEEGFLPTPRLRVNEPLRQDRVRNRYVHSLVTYLLASPNSPQRLDDLPLAEAVRQWRALGPPRDLTTVLVIDQLEEVLTLDPTDWSSKEGFFRELGTLLSTEPVWALLSMREDYMGGLDRYLRFLPGLLRSRYRLDFLTVDDARLAMQVPANQQRVEFKAEAADALIDRLTVVQVQRPGEEVLHGVKAPYVEPFQLQVVCRKLWKSIRMDRGNDFPTIEVADIEKHADVEQALMAYFDDTVTDVVGKTGANERKIRDWFEFQLITKQNFRSQTLRLPETEKADVVVGLLEEGYLIRGDVRGTSTWYELAHDRLIRPVLASNDSWRWDNLQLWQVMAYEWDFRDRHAAYLLPPEDLPSTSVRKDVTDVERAFIEASENQDRQKKQENQIGILARTRSAMTRLAWAAIIEAIVIIVLLISLIAK